MIQENEDEQILANIAQTIANNTICPIFSASNVTGQGIEQLKRFLFLTPAVSFNNIEPVTPHISDPSGETATPDYSLIETQFSIDSTYNVKGVGHILGGTLLEGQILIGNTYYLGPNKSGGFIPIVIKGIQENRVNAEEINAGCSACVHVKLAAKEAQTMDL
jgi:GTPase